MAGTVSFIQNLASRASAAAQNEGAYLWDGITHPVDAATAFWQNQTGTNPAKNAENAAWNAQWERDHPEQAAAQAAAKARQPYYGTGNAMVDGALNAAGSLGVHASGTFGNGSAPNITGGNVLGFNVGTPQNANTTKNDNSVEAANQYGQGRIVDAASLNALNAATDAQIGSVTSAYDPQMTINGGTDHSGVMTPNGPRLDNPTYTPGMAYPDAPPSSNSLGLSPIHLNAPAYVGQSINGMTWDGASWVSDAKYKLGMSQINPPAASYATNTVNGHSTTPTASVADDGTFSPIDPAYNDYRAYLGTGMDAEEARKRARANHPPLVTPEAQNPPVTNNTTPNGPTIPPGTGGLSADTLATLAAMGINIAGISAGAKAQADAASEGAKVQAKAAQDALTQQQNQFETIRADQEPWKLAGTAALGELTNFDKNNPAFKFNNDDPSYAFRLDEGRKALEASAAARGGILNGTTGKALLNYGQQAASQEYQNAYNRYQTTTNTKRNALQSLAGIGQTANQQVASAGQNFANNASNLITGAGTALANGASTAANANASGYVGMGNAVTNNLSAWLQNNNANAMVSALQARNK